MRIEHRYFVSVFVLGNPHVGLSNWTNRILPEHESRRQGVHHSTVPPATTAHLFQLAETVTEWVGRHRSTGHRFLTGRTGGDLRLPQGSLLIQAGDFLLVDGGQLFRSAVLELFVVGHSAL